MNNQREEILKGLPLINKHIFKHLSESRFNLYTEGITSLLSNEKQYGLGIDK